MENVNYIMFADGQNFDLAATPTGKAEKVGGIRRDVLSVTVKATYAEALAAFGQPWDLHVHEMRPDVESGELTPHDVAYSKENYVVLASICDNCDGTVTVRVTRKSTYEEDLEVDLKAEQKKTAALTVENAAKDAEIADLNTEIDNLVVEILTADAAAAETTEENTTETEEEVASDEGTTEQTV